MPMTINPDTTARISHNPQPGFAFRLERFVDLHEARHPEFLAALRREAAAELAAKLAERLVPNVAEDRLNYTARVTFAADITFPGHIRQALASSHRQGEAAGLTQAAAAAPYGLDQSADL